MRRPPTWPAGAAGRFTGAGITHDCYEKGAFEVIELDSSAGNAAGFGRNAHSVLAHEVRDRPGHPALAARERVTEFLRERLAPTGSGTP